MLNPRRRDAVKAAILEQFRAPLVLGEVDIDVVGPGEVRVRTVASGVCHSDRTVQEGSFANMPLPMVLGHEAAGVVEEVGPGVKDFVFGDHVVLCAHEFCGACEWCMRGLPYLCVNRYMPRADGYGPRLRVDGKGAAAYVGLGGFAAELLVGERTLVKIPDEMPFNQAALLGCAVVTGLGVVRHRAQIQIGDTVAVLGCGGVGLSVIQGAHLAGAARIVAIDISEDKLDRAREFGATDAVNATDVDPVKAVKDLLDGGADHALEVIGRAETIEQAFRMTRTHGTATVVGLTSPETLVSIPANELLMAEKRLQGSRSGSARFRLDIPLYCRFYLDGRLRLDDLVSESIGLEDVNRALDALDTSDGIRRVIEFS
jgi:S-(hydroxymethyl)glutathione dehydrogenase/alcohol dehydrogenase